MKYKTLFVQLEPAVNSAKMTGMILIGFISDIALHDLISNELELVKPLESISIDHEAQSFILSDLGEKVDAKGRFSSDLASSIEEYFPKVNASHLLDKLVINSTGGLSFK